MGLSTPKGRPGFHRGRLECGSRGLIRLIPWLGALAVVGGVLAASAVSAPSLPDCSNHKHFPNQQAAQLQFNKNRTTWKHLDADHDGMACERLGRPTVCDINHRFRWAVKTLQDRPAKEGKVKLSHSEATLTTVARLTDPRRVKPPKRLTKARSWPWEFRSRRVSVRLVKYKLVSGGKKGGDQDIHLVVADPDKPNTPENQMVVEFPNTSCARQAPKRVRRMMARARQALVRAYGQPPTHMVPLRGTACVRGVVFFDRPHAEGGARNGVELHPVTAFIPNATCRPDADTPPSSSSPTTPGPSSPAPSSPGPSSPSPAPSSPSPGPSPTEPLPG